MKFVMIGAGAVGGYFGGRLAQAGFELTFVARGKTLTALQEEGLRVESVRGDFTLPAVRATADMTDIGLVDVVLLGVKAWQVSEIAPKLAPLLHENTAVIPLQNGVEAPRQLMQHIGQQHTLGGMCKIMSYVVKPGHIRHIGAPPTIAFGELDNQPTERVRKIEAALKKADIIPSVTPSIQAQMWEKFALVSAFSGVGAVTRVPFGPLLAYAGTRQMIRQSMTETVAVGQAHGVPLADDLPDQILAFMDTLPENGSASMQRDIMAGNPSELDAQVGAIVRLGQEVAVPTPVNEQLYHSLKLLEMHSRGEIELPSF